jgi:ABC-2 type transport system ATP-binding protein
VISARGLTRAFDGTIAVEHLSFDVPDGKLCALLGPNGAGKTTTVRMLLGLIGPTAGTARVAGHELSRGPEANHALRGVCGLLTEAPGFYDRMSAWDNLLFFGRLYGLGDGVLKPRLQHYLKQMELWDRRDGLVGEFSKGMKQRLAIIRALFHDPKVVFLDEPTSGLDPEAALAVRELILRLKSEGRTILVCTHNLDEAERLADLIGIMRRRLLAFGTIADLRAGAGGGSGSAVRITLTSGAAEHAAALAQLPFVHDPQPTGAIIACRVDDPTADVPRVVAWLVGRGAGVLEVRPAADSLETIYLQHVRGDA